MGRSGGSRSFLDGGEISLQPITLEFLALLRSCSERGTPSRPMPQGRYRALRVHVEHCGSRKGEWRRYGSAYARCELTPIAAYRRESRRIAITYFVDAQIAIEAAESPASTLG